MNIKKESETLKIKEIIVNNINNTESIQNNNNEIPHDISSNEDSLDSYIDKYIIEYQEDETDKYNFDQAYIDNINSQNMDSEDKIDRKDYDKNFLNKTILKSNFSKYFVFSTYKTTMVINSYKFKISKEEDKKEDVCSHVPNDENIIENTISIKFDENKSKDCLKEEKEKSKIKFLKILIKHGKINLLKNFLLKKFEKKALTNEIKNLIFGYISSSRYEYFYFSKIFNIIIVGNRCGDFHFFKLKMNVKFADDEDIKNEKIMKIEDNPSSNEDDYTISFEEKPIFILSHTYKICGFKVFEIEDKNNPINNFVEIYFIDLQGRLECYKLKFVQF